MNKSFWRQGTDKNGRHAGFVLLETLCAVTLFMVVLTLVTVQIGNARLVRQKRQLELAARQFIADVRQVQQKNMFAHGEKGLKIVPVYDSDEYRIYCGTVYTSKDVHKFSAVGCGGVYFASLAGEIIFTPSGSVNEEKQILLRHDENTDLSLVLNLQPVTGRIEIGTE